MNTTGQHARRTSSAAGAASLLSSGMFQGRLTLVDATHIALTPWNGNRILLNSQLATIPSGGVTRLITDNLITNTGADAGAGGMVANTYYNVYISSSAATTFPNQVRGSTTNPTQVVADGIYRLGAAGNAAEWLWIGGVYVTAGPAILDANQTRHIASWYNPLLQRVHHPILWNNNNAETTFTLASANWAPIAGGGTIGAEDVLSIVDLGVNDYNVLLDFNIAQTAATEWMVGICPATTTPSTAAPSACCRGGPVTVNVGRGDMVGYWQRTLGIGITTFTAGGRSAAAANLVFNADMVRNGATGDPIGCMFSGCYLG